MLVIKLTGLLLLQLTVRGVVRRKLSVRGLSLIWSVEKVADTTCGVRGVVVLIIYETRMPDGVAARTDGVDIWVDDRLNDVQRKCAIAHELEHVRRGHGTVQTEAVEMSVRYTVAKELLPLDEIVGVCKKGKSLKMIARELGVTRQVLMDRAATLTDAQAELAGCLDCRLCPVIAARFPSRVLVAA